MITRLLKEIILIARLLPSAYFLRWCGAFIRALPAVLRQRSLGPVDQAFGPSFAIRGPGGRLVFAGCDLGVVREIFGHRCYAEPEDLRDARCVVDLGANCGVFTLFVLCHVPEARLFSVETQPEMIATLRANVQRNGFAGQVTPINALVGGVYNAWSEDLLRRHPQVTVWAPEQTLPADGPIDFLKCDIEGAEFQLLDPVPAWFRRVRRFALEYHGDWAKGTALAESLRAAGFVVSQRSHRTLGYLMGSRAHD